MNHACLRRSLAVLLVALCAIASTPLYAAAQPGGVDLNPVPPDLTTSVDPNIVVTFDDSGSMVWTHMGDAAPLMTPDANYNNASWNGPWRCAGVIDSTVDLAALGASTTPEQKAKARAMNGVYYNPRITYAPPLYKNGVGFQPADATLKKVWVDGIAINKPGGLTANATATFGNNPDINGSASDTGITDLTGQLSVTTTSNSRTGFTASCPANADAGSCSCSGFGSTRTCRWTVTTTTDNRWKCGAGGNSPFSAGNPFDGTNGNPNGGPYYYRFKGTLAVDATTGMPSDTSSTGVNSLYNPLNWEPIPVPTDQYQNFANWYAYYRTRNLMARTALSRVFGALGENVRVAWQNLGNNTSQPWGAIITNGTTIISNLTDTNPTTDTRADNYRSKFFDWIFKVGASNGTPNRSATNRAGAFFAQGSPATLNLTNPYYQPATATGTTGMELSCRQNFHMLLTDGMWNGDTNIATPSKLATNATTFYADDSTSPATPAPFSYAPGDAETRIYSNNSQNKLDTSLANIAFQYWATDLRTDLPNRVPRYVPDKSTNLDGTGSLGSGVDPMSNKVVYFNPANDVATWQHVVQFMIALGVDGTRRYPEDYVSLRKGTLTWPTPAADVPAAIDDMWHAAVNSRGSYFSAGDPTSLVKHMTDVITNILNRSSSSTALSPTMSLITAATSGFVAGYNSGDWSGTLYREPLDANGTPGGPANASWEAGCALTGGTFGTGMCALPNPPPDRNAARNILSVLDNGTTSIAFAWGNLSAAQQAALNTSPGGTVDGYGSFRVDYLRGKRSQESATPQLRKRQSLLGAVVNSRPVYVSAPTGGFTDSFPQGSPEYDAAAAATPVTYAQFVYDNRARPATVYVGADDGLLHAFNAADGSERWAYLPGMLMKNVSSATTPLPLGNINRVTRMTDPANNSLVPGVDDMPIVQDAFYGGSWHSILLGSMRLGGRGVFALDVTHPASVSESNRNLLWEIDNTTTGFGNLGYTYASTNIARIACNRSPCSGTGGTAGGTWVALVSSGYFPLPNQTPPDPAASEAAANQTSLFVIDLQTGALISEIKTATAAQFSQAKASFGLSTPNLYDLNGDQVDDIAVAGDLAGNLWRFDLSSPNPANWTVDLMFKTYSVDTDVGRYPISVQPAGMRDPAANTPIFVFGTGKYLGPCDRTATASGAGCGYDSNSVTQAFFGIRDYGTGSINYPIQVSQLFDQTMAQSAGVRTATSAPVPLANRGWRMQLNPGGQAPGERAVIPVTPDYTDNRAILTTLIPTSAVDPCSPGRNGAIMVVNAASGGTARNQASVVTGVNNSVGKIFTGTYSIPLSGGLSGVATQGGLSITLPGLQGINISKVPPNRGAWRELLNEL